MSKKTERRSTGKTTTKVRAAMHRRKQLDASVFEDRFGDETQLMWIVDEGGDLDRWLNAGAEPVERASGAVHDFEGLSDRHQSRWMRVVAGADKSGNTAWQYLLAIDKDVYNDIKLGPEKERQLEIQKAMGLNAQEGVAPMEARAVNKAGVITYAPYNVDGSMGYNATRTTN